MEILAAEHNTRIPQPFSGWALQRATSLDLNGSRGLIADIAISSFLKRQAVFAVLSTIDPADPTPFLDRLGEPEGNFGNVIRTRQARDLIAAAFGVDDVPAGYCRALTRIGFKPLDEPHLYRRLFEIFTNEAESLKAHALRYCGPIDASRIQVVDVLDPVLICAETLKNVRGVSHARHANLLMRFLRSVCSTATDEMLAAGIRQAVGNGGLERFAQKVIQRADRFPAPPLPLQLDFIPLTSASEMIRLGQEIRNCLATKVPHALLGLGFYYRTQVQVCGALWSIVVELSPLSNGTWMVDGVFGPGNQKPPLSVMLPLIRRLTALGAVVAANPVVHADAKDLVRPLGVYAFGEFQLLSLEDAEDEDDISADNLDMAAFETILSDVEREFGLA